MTRPADASAAELLLQKLTAAVTAQAIHVAAELGLPDLVTGAPRTVEDLARATDTHADALRRLLRTLAGEGIFAEEGEDRFRATEASELLRSDSPTRLRDFARMFGDLCARSLVELEHSVRTGAPSFERVFGAPAFDYLQRNPEKARVFDGAMTGIHGPETVPMIEAYDFGVFDTVVDVGGASGATLVEVLRAHPRLRGILFDMPHVAEQAAERIAEAGLADRCRAEGGSFFDGVPAGADCYMMRHVIHDWDAERSVAILRHCREAMRPGGKVLVVEMVLPEGNEPHPGKMLDLVMLTVPGGRERTPAEYDRLFAAAGLRRTRIVPTASAVSVVEAEAV